MKHSDSTEKEIWEKIDYHYAFYIYALNYVNHLRCAVERIKVQWSRPITHCLVLLTHDDL